VQSNFPNAISSICEKSLNYGVAACHNANPLNPTSRVRRDWSLEQKRRKVGFFPRKKESSIVRRGIVAGANHSVRKEGKTALRPICFTVEERVYLVGLARGPGKKGIGGKPGSFGR